MPIEELSVLLPAWNEEVSLPGVLDRALEVLPRRFRRFELVVVDDGSADRTLAIAREYAERHPEVIAVAHERNFGMGRAIRTGAAAATCEWVTSCSSDGQVDPDDFRKYREGPEADLLVGVRPERRYGPIRTFYSLLNRRMVAGLFDVDLRDTAWVKAIRRERLLSLGLESDGFLWETELLARARRAGLSMREVEIPTHPRTGGEASGGKLRNVLRTARGMIELWADLGRTGDMTESRLVDSDRVPEVRPGRIHG